MPTNFPTSLDADGTLLVAKDFCRSTLNTTMTNVQNTCILVDASTFPVPTGGAAYYAVIDAVTSSSREIISYTGVSTNTLTGVTRGLGGTTGVPHTAGVLVEQNIVSFFHETVKAAILAIETKAGIDSSAVNTTFDFKLGEVTGGDKAVGKTATQTLTNKTLTSPAINTGTLTTAIWVTSATITSATFTVIPGVTSITFRNNANNASNMIIADDGTTTFRAAVGGITTLTATSLAGTITTAAQANITSVGTLNGLTVATSAMTVNTAGNATFNRQYLAAKFAVTFSATPTFDFNNGNVQSVSTLTGNITSSTFSNGISGGRYVLVFTQDGTGNRTVVWPASVKWGGGTAPTLSGANKVDVFGFVYDGTSYYGTAGLNF